MSILTPALRAFTLKFGSRVAGYLYWFYFSSFLSATCSIKYNFLGGFSLKQDNQIYLNALMIDESGNAAKTRREWARQDYSKGKFCYVSLEINFITQALSIYFWWTFSAPTNVKKSPITLTIIEFEVDSSEEFFECEKINFGSEVYGVFNRLMSRIIRRSC